MAHVDALLKHEFPEFRQSYVTSMVKKHKSHLFPMLKELEATRHDILGKSDFFYSCTCR